MGKLPQTKDERQARMRKLGEDIQKFMRDKCVEDDIASHDLLAVMAYLTGQVMALQDQTKMTPQRAIDIVSRNIEAGNQHVVNGLLGMTPEGSA